ncbi:MAG: PAS-domain containing protein [Alphaproteobacteria bacterium]|nr:PAS-domain containing protein [Alphaproteobacteria bacterium]MBV9862489.1 PAS-domain containing protein [Alphaproteobacteria bacterium]
MIEFAAGLLLILAMSLGVLWLRARARVREAVVQRQAAERNRAECEALLEAVPLAGFRWSAEKHVESGFGVLPGTPLAGTPLAGTPQAGAQGTPAQGTPAQGTPAQTASRTTPESTGPSYWEFVNRLIPQDAARLQAGIAELRRNGRAFAMRASDGAGTTYSLDGRRTGRGQTVLWIADATSVQRAEAGQAAAERARAALRETLDAMPLPAWRRSPDLRLTDCNAAFATALDTTREAALADQRELAPRSGSDKALELARRAAVGMVQTERRHVVIAGSRRLLEITEMPDQDGGTIGFAADRTDLESAEAELSRHINAHGEVLESIHAAVAIYGGDKRLKFFNSAFAALWGLEEDWLRGEPSLDEVLERLRERRRIPELADFRAFKRQQLRMFTSLIEPQQELMHLPDDRTLSLSVSPHPFGGLTFVYEDVTDRLALERSFNTLTEVQRETLNHLFEGIAVYGSDGRLKLHNPAYREIWGLSETDVAGEPHISEIVEKTRALYDDGTDWPAMKERIIARVTEHALIGAALDRRDGSVLQVATVPLPDGNVLITNLDVTDTARFERALQERNEALETAGRLKSEFIANVSYELRTPLNAIIGFAEILANQYFGTLSPRQLEYSRGILDSSHRLMSLINDILDLATIEAGYMTLETSRVEIREMMQSVLTLTRERARNQRLELSLHCPPDLGVVQADERRLKQALFNLISNAIKFTPPGGSIDIEARREGGDVLLSVSDTGVGIPQADQARVFEKFERGDPQARHSGAGLGLSLVKSLVELHGGTVEIESNPGRGTTVRCRLPARRLVAVPFEERTVSRTAM